MNEPTFEIGKRDWYKKMNQEIIDMVHSQNDKPMFYIFDRNHGKATFCQLMPNHKIHRITIELKFLDATIRSVLAENIKKGVHI